MPKPPKNLTATKKVYCDRIYLPTGQRFVHLNTNAEVLIHQKVQSYLNIKDWYQLIVKGSDASGAYNATGGACRAGRIQGRQRTPTDLYLYFGSMTPPGPGSYFDTSLDTRLRDLAYHRLLNKLRSNIGQAQLGEPVAEAREIGGLVRQSAELATKAVSDLITLRKNPKLGAKRLAKLASETWLGYGFAVTPLISDTTSAVLALDDYLKREDRTVVLSGHAKDSGNIGKQGATSTQFTNFANVIGDDEGSYTKSYKYLGAFNLKIRSSNSYTAAQHLGLGFADVIPTLWAVTYASWIADYFVNVGNYLEDTFFTLPGELKYLNLTFKYQGSVHRTFRAISAGSATSESFSSTQAYLEYWTFNRQVLHSLPVTGLHFHYQDRIGKHAVNKLLNLCAVLGKRI